MAAGPGAPEEDDAGADPLALPDEEGAPLVDPVTNKVSSSFHYSISHLQENIPDPLCVAVVAFVTVVFAEAPEDEEEAALSVVFMVVGALVCDLIEVVPAPIVTVGVAEATVLLVSRTK